MISRFSMRTKILIFLIPALLYMTGTSSILIFQNYQLQEKAIQLELSGRYFLVLSQLIQIVQKERGISAGVLTGKIERKELDQHRTAVDAKIEEVKKILPQLSESLRENTSAKLKDYFDIRLYVDNNGIAVESTKRFSILNENLISLQTNRSREFSLNGLENRLISQSIFEMAKENTGRLRAFVTGILAQDKAISSADLMKINMYRQGIIINLESQGLIISEQTRRDVGQVLASADWIQVAKTLENVGTRASSGGYGEDSRAYFDTITRVIDSIAKIINHESDVLIRDIQSTQSSSKFAFIAYLVCGTIGVFLITFLALRITKEAVSSLNTVANDLSQSASVVASSSEQLSSASEALSSGVTEQAAALQETVVSLDEIRAMVAKNTENSKRAKELSTVSNSEVEKGKEAVSQMLIAVDEIQRSNEAIEKQVESSNHELTSIIQIITEIGNKTKVINDIVFQTKLLSFNASVEAARAGEHGKGFSVVAEEVGNLATMSGNAAKEIVQLLENSIEKVEATVRETKTQIGHLILESKEKIDTGISTAKQCEEVLVSIAGSSSELEHVISEVATASNEQSSGIDEIAKAMNELDQVTQSNSTTASQSSSIADKLSQETKDIESFVHKLIAVVYGKKDQSSVGSSEMQKKDVVQPAQVINSFTKKRSEDNSLPSHSDQRFTE